MAFGSELDEVLDTLRRAFPVLAQEAKRAYAAKLCEVVPELLEAVSGATPDAGAAAQHCLSILRAAPDGPRSQCGESGEEAAVALLETVAGRLRDSRRLPRGVTVEDARVTRLRPSRNVKKSLDCRLKVSLRVDDGTLRVVLLAVEAKRTQTINVAALRTFLNHDVAVRAEAGHDAVLTAFVSWLCDIPKAMDFEEAGRMLFGSASANVETVAAVLCHEVETLARRVAANDGAVAAEQLHARKADYLRDRLEAIISQRSALSDEETLVRGLISPGAAAAVDCGHRAGVEKRPRAASSGPPWWKRPRAAV